MDVWAVYNDQTIVFKNMTSYIFSPFYTAQFICLITASNTIFHNGLTNPNGSNYILILGIVEDS